MLRLVGIWSTRNGLAEAPLPGVKVSGIHSSGLTLAYGKNSAPGRKCRRSGFNANTLSAYVITFLILVRRIASISSVHQATSHSAQADVGNRSRLNIFMRASQP